MDIERYRCQAVDALQPYSAAGPITARRVDIHAHFAPGAFLLPRGNRSRLELREWVKSHGFKVESIRVIPDSVSGASPAFGYISIGESREEAEAIRILNGQILRGRILQVKEDWRKTEDRLDAKTTVPGNSVRTPPKARRDRLADPVTTRVLPGAESR